MGGSIFWLVLTLATYCSCYDLCSENRNCRCHETALGQWLVQCSRDGYLAFTVIIFNSAVLLFGELRCNQSVSWHEAEFRHAKLLGEASIVSVFDCSLPDESFGTIARRLGFEDTFNFRFSSHHRLGRSLTRRHLFGLPKLHLLDLSENGLTALTSDLLRDVPELEWLSLASNEITSLPREIFGGLRWLRQLHLDDNEIEVLDSELFSNCTALSRLNVTKNLLKTLNHRIFHGLINFQSLFLDDNPLAITSDDLFESLQGLRNLHISRCQFSSLPEGLLRRMKFIRVLKLCDNRGNLTTLPQQLFNNATSPVRIYLQRNRFSRLSEHTFRGSRKLRQLVLTGNAFSTLPANIFGKLAELVLLDLSDNGLTDLPDGLFRGLTQLKNLTLSHNRVTSLSELLFADLYSLRELNLSFNRLSRLRQRFFQTLANLRIARFSHNFLRFPEDGQFLFQYCVSLEELILDHNNVTSLSISMWDIQVARTLQRVDLSYNRLSTIQVENRLPKSMRVVFDVRHNYVQQMIAPILNSAELVFMLDDNPIHCGCNLYSWNSPVDHRSSTLSERKLTLDPGNATCASPEWMYGTRIADVDWTKFLCRPSLGADEYIRCAAECDCWWRPSDLMRVIDCSSRNLTKVPDRIIEFSDDKNAFPTDDTVMLYVWPGRATELRLEENRFAEIPLFNNSIYKPVKRIFLSFNNFSVLSRITLPPRLQVLRLDHCNLTRFEATALDVIMDLNNLQEVDLDENPWDCHRDTRNALLAIDNKFERVTRYAGGEHICLDPGRVRHGGKEHQFYITYTRF